MYAAYCNIYFKYDEALLYALYIYVHIHTCMIIYILYIQYVATYI